VLLALCIPLAHGASGLVGVLKNSPFASFTDEDYKQFFVSASKVADGPVGGPAAQWSNANSGASGSVQSTRVIKRPEGDCRELRGKNSAGGRTEPFRVTVCKAPDGSWKLVPTEPEAKAAAPSPQDGPISVPARYSGVLPCADCPGMKYDVDLHADGTYRMRTTYLEKGPGGSGKNVDEGGAWQRVASGTRITLRNDNNATTTFIIADANTLRMVDASGHEFQTKLNYDLKRAAAYTPLAAN
jgi:uncharacterized lipoprotein NlpE involved in copper resistance/surface antigen